MGLTNNDSEIAKIQAEGGNRLGHFRPDVVHRRGEDIVPGTGIDGSIRIRSDGTNLLSNRWLPETGWGPVAKQFPLKR